MAETLLSLHAAHSATLEDVAGHALPLGYGDLAAEVAALRTGAGLLDLSASGVLLLRGVDAATFLNGIITTNVATLAPGQTRAGLFCANRGKLLESVEIVRTRPEQILLVTEPGRLAAVAQHVEAYHVREQVEIGQVPLLRLDLIGPGAPAALQAAGIDPAQPLASFQEQPLLTLPLPFGGHPRFMLLTPAPNAPALAEALLPAARLVGLHAYDEARLWAGVPRFGVDYGPEHLPAEAARYDTLSFNKGCYVGQEPHARLHNRGGLNQKLMGLRWPEAAPLAPGDELFLEGQSVARVTSAGQIAEDGARAGIAMVRVKQAGKDARLARSPDGAPDVTLLPLSTDFGARPA